VRVKVNQLFFSSKEHNRKAYQQLVAMSNSGNPSAQYTLGKLYYSGDSYARQNKATALTLFRKAAQQGWPEAEHILGLIYFTGDDVPQSFELAASWFVKAAKHGFLEAQYYIGDAYCYGKGVPRDPVQAYAWWSLASLQEHYKSGVALSELTKTLNRNQLIQGNKLCRQYLIEIVQALPKTS
jgi:TPR repeat protein